MEKYDKMLKMGLPEGAVKLSMTKDGVTAEKAKAFWGDGDSDSDSDSESASCSTECKTHVLSKDRLVFFAIGDWGGMFVCLSLPVFVLSVCLSVCLSVFDLVLSWSFVSRLFLSCVFQSTTTGSDAQHLLWTAGPEIGPSQSSSWA